MIALAPPGEMRVVRFGQYDAGSGDLAETVVELSPGPANGRRGLCTGSRTAGSSKNGRSEAEAEKARCRGR